MSKPDKRILTTIELSPENLSFWKSIPHGDGKKLINYLFDNLRLHSANDRQSFSDLIARISTHGLKL